MADTPQSVNSERGEISRLSLGGSEHNQNAHGVSLTSAQQSNLDTRQDGLDHRSGTEEMIDMTGQMVALLRQG
jgi:hypothetical protein